MLVVTFVWVSGIAVLLYLQGGAKSEIIARSGGLINDGLRSKGALLATTYSTVLRPLLADFAIGDIRELVETAVTADVDLIYGVVSEKSMGVVASASSIGLDDEFFKTRLHAALGEQRLTVGTRPVREFAAPIEVDGAAVGMVRFGLGTGRVAAAASHDEALVDAQFRRLLVILGGVGGAVLVITFFIAAVVSRSIVGPLSVMVERMRQIASGSGGISTRIKVSRSDEIGALGFWFNSFLDKLEHSVRELNHASAEMSKGNFDYRIDIHDTGEIGELRDNLNLSMDATEVVIRDINRVTTALAQRDLTAEPQRRLFNGSFAAICANWTTAMGSLRSVIEETRGVAGSLGRVSVEISAASEDLAAGATEEAAIATETTTTMASWLDQITYNSNMAQDAAVFTGDVKKRAQECHEQMAEMAVAMQEINRASMAIVSIVAVIEEIASQTSLLALNASVEAARAGDQGKGFAVVADEVRVLAERSSKASKETSQMLEVAMAQVCRGEHQTYMLSETLKKIVNRIDALFELSQRLASAGNGQQERVDVTLAGAKELRDTSSRRQDQSESLYGLAQKATRAIKILEREVGKFRLR